MPGINIKGLEKVLKVLSNKRRLMILVYLKRGQSGRATVGEIANVINLSFTATSRHLKLLFMVDVLDRKHKSLEVYYYIASNQHKIVKHILDSI